ncbi:hypothetical protein [Kocuria palustris]|uniref:hypothetical protein n=1 Tax=Kocuria palustris TaxID=71999 RepID=UPI00119F75F7|nr:hypothetical protein [Kocuria palustris]
MALRVFPEDSGVLHTLAQLVDQVQEAVRCCSELLGADEDRLGELTGLAESIGTRTADLHFGAMTSARTTYALPLPRSDIYILSSHLARATEHLLLAADALAASPHRTAQTRYITEQLATISHMASLSRTAVLRLSSLKGLDAYWFDLHRLRKQTERTYLVHRQQLFGDLDAAEAFQALQIADQLHDAARSMASLSHEIGRISVSEA